MQDADGPTAGDSTAMVKADPAQSSEDMEKEAEKKKLEEELKQFNKALVKVQNQYLEEARKNKADGVAPTQTHKDLKKEMKEMQAPWRAQP